MTETRTKLDGGYERHSRDTPRRHKRFPHKDVKGFGRTGGKTEIFRGSAYQVDFVPKIKIEVVVADKQVHPVLDALERSAKPGTIGDGKVFVLGVDEALRIRTGERGESAI